jgi:hypothetical protein
MSDSSANAPTGTQRPAVPTERLRRDRRSVSTVSRGGIISVYRVWDFLAIRYKAKDRFLDRIQVTVKPPSGSGSRSAE